MTTKFGRNYNLLVATKDLAIDPTGAPIYITLPYTIEMDITRNIMTSANICSIRIYNLGVKTRNQIRFNLFNSGEIRPIVLQAGYGTTNVPIIFSGNITQAWSVREGVNFITTIECFDGGFAFANATTNKSYASGTPQVNVLTDLVNSLAAYNVTLGAIGNYPGTISRGNTYSGSTTDILRELTNGGFYIDNGKAHCLGNSECVAGGVPLIDAASGLLGTPTLEQTVLSFDMLFEPGVIAGQQIQLMSATEANYNGFYKLISIKHRGMISPAVCGDAITSLQMYYGPVSLSVIEGGQ